MEKKEKNFIKGISTISAIIIGVTLAAYKFNNLLHYDYFINPNDYDFFTDKLGQFGDFIGGFLGTLLTGIATYLVYKTYISQENELKLQRQLIAQQQFESTFFNMLNVHRDMKNSLQTENRIFWFTDTQIEDFDANSDILTMIINDRKKVGLSIFRILRNDLTRLYSLRNFNAHTKLYGKNINFKNNSYIIEINKDLNEHYESMQNNTVGRHMESASVKKFEKEKIKLCFKLLLKNHSDIVSPYCRNVYQISKYIRKCEENKLLGINKEIYQNYIDIFQSQLSLDEQFLLFYYFIHFSIEDKDIYSNINLANHYKLLENLGSDNLLDNELHNNKNFYNFDIKKAIP